MNIIIPLEAYPFTHMASMKYFDYKNIQVIVYYPSSHVGLLLNFTLCLMWFYLLLTLSLILLKDTLRHIKNFNHLFGQKLFQIRQHQTKSGQKLSKVLHQQELGERLTEKTQKQSRKLFDWLLLKQLPYLEKPCCLLMSGRPWVP